MKIALYLGDSILRNLPPESIDATKKKFGLDHCRFFSFGGYTTHDLISKSGVVEWCLDQEPCCDFLYLCSRSNDGSKYTGSVESCT
jgi:hypothetical protein